MSARPTSPDDALLRPQSLCDGVSVAFSGRGGGMSAEPFATLNLSDGVGDDPAAVAGNRDLVQRAIGAAAISLAWMRQVHGTAVTWVGEDHGRTQPAAAGPAQRADAQCTRLPGIALGVLGADCAPVLVADPVARVVGAAHAGRPGMAAGVVSALIGAMSGAGANVSRMHAIVGPAICGGCYEVPASMREQVAAAVPGAACLTRDGTPGIDLRAGLHGQLERLGVASITHDARCTAESAELYSYRRDGTTGRFAGLIWLDR